MDDKQYSSARYWVIIAAIIGFWMVYLEMSGVAVILPTVQKSFHLSGTSLQWIVNAYLVSLSISILFSGRLSDQFGHRNSLLASLIIFFIGSVVCALATGIVSLLIGRIIQGVGGSFLIILTPTIILNAFPKQEYGRALGTAVAVGAISLAIGPFLGGVFTEFLNWRWVFWINVPASVLNFVIAYLFVKNTRLKDVSKHLDFAGFILSGIAIAALLIAIMQGNNWGWGSAWIITCFILAIVFALAFFFYENYCSEPLLDFKLFLNKVFLCVCFNYSLTQMLFVMQVFLMVVLQDVYGFSPLMAGVAGLPMVVPYALLAPVVGKIYDKYWARLPICSGLLINIIGCIWIGIFIETLNYWWVFPGLLLIGLGLPFVTAPSMVTGLAVVSEEKRGIASAVISGTRQLGASIGLGVMGALIVGINHFYLDRALHHNQLRHVPRDLAYKVLSSPQLISHYHISPHKQLRLMDTAKHAYAFGTGMVFGIMAMLIIINLILALAVLHKRNI